MDRRIRQLEIRLAECMLTDQPRLRSRLAASGKRKSEGGGMEVIDAIAGEIERSIQRRAKRREGLPTPSYPEDLPVVQRRADIAAAIAENQVVVICGETGSGKTTQLPKICLELGRGVGGMIGHTQPRRIAARSVAARIAQELGSPLGRMVGYKVRFHDRVGQDSLVKIMTDGILLAETQHDRDLLQYDTIIIDEAHERSLNIDFLLGYIRQLLPRRADLKVVITSATIDPRRFSRHFDDAPVIEVAGRTYPVETLYRPTTSDEAGEPETPQVDAVVQAVDEVAALGEGDVLVFLSGEREIRETAEALRKHHPPATEILPLYARLSIQEQQRVFEPHGGRRIVLATNVAETSLTVPGIRYVIDPGEARVSRYSSNSRVQRLPVERVSQASADQRKGRCGRVGPGVCVRLYGREDFESRPAFTDPEILRANLAGAILQMKALRLGDIERFPFIDPPRAGMIREGHQTLTELGAIDDHGEITPIGRELARLPVDPRIGRMILAARAENSLHEVLIIASALATQDPRLRPMEHAGAADLAHASFADERSDFLSYLKLWDFFHEQQRELSHSKLRSLCRERFLSYLRFREWHDVHQQLHALAAESGMKVNQQPARYEDIHRALLCGLLTNVGFRHEGHEYLGVRDRKFHLFPGSHLFQQGPKWIMAAELVETTRLFARTVARIHPEWIEQLGGHLVKRTHTAPYWNRRTAHVEAFERVALYGLTIVPRRRVHYGKVDPKAAREVFIQQALIEGEYDPPGGRTPRFVESNRWLLEEIRTSEAKSRRRDVLVDVQAIYRFFDARVPAGVFNGPIFEKWRGKAERESPDLLCMRRDDLVRQDARIASQEEFPDAAVMHGVRLPLEYQLDPGGEQDGVTLVVPVEMLNAVDPDRCEWLVPGLLKEKVVSLIKSLPKPMRVHLAPAPDFAETAVKRMAFGKGDLYEALSQALGSAAGIAIPREAWNASTLADHLRLNFKVVDDEGSIIRTGRDLTEIRRALGPQAQARLAASLNAGFERHYLVAWDFGDLPEEVELRPGRTPLVGHPALVDKKETVSLALFESRSSAAAAHRAGVRRLFALQVGDELASHIDYLPDFEQMAMHFAPLGPSERLREQLIDLVAERVFIGDEPPPRAQVDFERRLRSGSNNLWPAVSEVGAVVGGILAAHHAVDLQLCGLDNPFMSDAVGDVRLQLSHLMSDGFLVNVPYRWLLHYPRYLRAIGSRLRRLTNAGLARDREASKQVADYWARYESRAEKHRALGVMDPALEHFRWMIEELRVSLFAQELRTSLPVSSKRMEQQWALVQA